MADEDEVGQAIKEQEIARIQRESDLENQMFGVGRRAEPIDVRGPDPVGAAIRQREVSGIRRRGELDQTFGRQPGFATNVPAPSPDDLIDSAITSKRNLIESRQTQLRSALPLTTTDRYGQQDRRRILDEYETLSHADSALQRDQFNRAHYRALENKEKFSTEKDAAHAKAASEIFEFLHTIPTDRFPLGSEDYTNYVGRTFARRTDWLAAMKGNPVLADEIKSHLKLHEDTGDTARTLAETFGGQAVPSHVGPGGISYDIDLPGQGKNAFQDFKKQLELTDRNLSPADFEDGTNWKAQVDAKGKKTGNVFLEFQGKTSKEYITLPQEKYRQLKQQHDVLTGKQSATPAPTSTPKKTWKYNSQTGQLE